MALEHVYENSRPPQSPFSAFSSGYMPSSFQAFQQICGLVGIPFVGMGHCRTPYSNSPNSFTNSDENGYIGRVHHQVRGGPETSSQHFMMNLTSSSEFCVVIYIILCNEEASLSLGPSLKEDSQIWAQS